MAIRASVIRSARLLTRAVEQLADDYRFWARLPPEVTAVILLPEVPEYPIHPMAARPRLKRGVCTGCGCTDKDPCIVEDFMGPVGCHWVDDAQTRCSACGPGRVHRAKRSR